MLGSLVLVGCAFAGLSAIAIVFVLYGPLPVNRRVTRLSRLAPAQPFVASAPRIAMPATALAAQPAFSSSDVFTTLEPDFDRPAPKVMIADGTPPPVSATVQKRRAAAAAEPVAPLRLRRPGNPPPMPRSRAARGSEIRHREPATFDVEHTALETSPFAHPVHTALETSPFAQATATFVYEDATFEEPGTRVRRR
jgi:hypothetical protein